MSYRLFRRDVGNYVRILLFCPLDLIAPARDAGGGVRRTYVGKARQ
jgi:hypothetical protein